MSQAPARAEATGQLGVTPLGDVLISLLDRRLSGSLVLEEPGGAKTAFTVSAGSIVKGRTAHPVVRLGELLIARGSLRTEALEAALAIAAQRRALLGTTLLQSGAVDAGALRAALAEQLAMRLIWASERSEQTVFGFYGGIDFLSAWGGGAVDMDPLALIWRCCRERAQPRRVEVLLGRLAARRLELHPHAQPERFGLTAEEAALVQGLRAGAPSLDALFSGAPALGARGGALVYVLALTRHIDVGDGREPLGVGQALASDPAPTRTAVRAREAETGAETSPQARIAGSSNSASETWPFPPGAATGARPAGRPSGETWPHAPRVPPTAADRSGVTASARPIASSAAEPGGRPGAVTGDSQREGWPTGTRTPAPSASSRPPVLRLPGTLSSRPPLSRPPSSRPTGARLPLPPPSSRPPELVLNDLLEREILQRAAQAAQLDHYQALGVERTATAEQIHAAYLQQVKRWHPDRLPASLAHRRHEAARVFSRVSEANRVLGDPSERARYDGELGSGENEEATVQRVLAAAEHFRRAELLAKRSDFAAALPHAEAAYQGDPDSEEHGALYAYLLARSEERLDTRRLSELSSLVDRAVRRDAENARWLFYRGSVSQRAGRVEEAMKDFRMVLRLDPNHIDAARELRLYNIRKERTSDRPGLLGQLFGRPSSQPGKSHPPRAPASKTPPNRGIKR